jgi:hypothetical protein
MKQWIKHLCLIMFGLLTGYLLAPLITITDSDADVNLTKHSAITATAEINENKALLPPVTVTVNPDKDVAVNALRDKPADLKLPDGLAWHPPKSLMPDFFVPDAKPFTADTYQQALQQLNRQDAELFEQLNQSLFGSFNFVNPQQYQSLLRLGMPTTEELRYVHSKPLEVLLQEQRQLRNQLSALNQSEQASAIQNYDRLIALLKNRAADEMLAEYRQYHAGYQTGEPILEQADWPSDLVDKYRLMKQAYAFSTQPGNVVNQIAMFKIEQQLHEGLPASHAAIWLGVIKRDLPDFVSQYGAMIPLSDEQKELATLVSTAIR